MGKVFLVKNENNHKVIKILGIKISFKQQTKCQNKIKIFVVYHKPSFVFKNSICTPIHVGRGEMLKNNPANLSKKEMQWMLDNTIGDDTGDNISYLNPYVSEMTAIYWAWKNYEKIGNPDIIGFIHYRTVLMLHTYPQYLSNYLDLCGYERNFINSLFRKNKAITGFWLRIGKSMYDFYHSLFEGHNIMFYDALFELFRTKYKKDYKRFYKWSKTPYRGGPFKNLFITSKEEFFKYCEWIFPILLDIAEIFKDYQYKDAKEKRNMAWLAEILTAFYFDTYVGEKNCARRAAIRPMVEEN